VEHSFDARSTPRIPGGEADAITREHNAEARPRPNVAFGAGRFRPTTAGSIVALNGTSRSRHCDIDAATRVADWFGERETAAESSPHAVAASAFADARLFDSRVMRRARLGIAPPPNPAPLKAPAEVSTPKAKAAIPEVVTAKAERKAALAEAVTAPPEPQPATGQGEMRAQEQTEEVREAAKGAIEETAPPAEAGAEVPDVAGGAAPAPAPAEVQEAPAVAAADMKEETAAEAEGEKAGEEAKKEEAKGEADAVPKKKAPASPQEDPAFHGVVARAQAVAAQQAHNKTAKRKAAEAQAAAGPANEPKRSPVATRSARWPSRSPRRSTRRASRPRSSRRSTRSRRTRSTTPTSSRAAAPRVS
jgi:hypothetical protein